MAQEDRTSQKLRFARVHLDELRRDPRIGCGDDFERAHHEAFLAQLFGAYSSFLHELNTILKCCLDPSQVTLGHLRNVLRDRDASIDLLSTLYLFTHDSNTWFFLAKEFRDVTIHYSGIPLSFYVGGAEDGRVALKHPVTMAELPGDAFTTLESWLNSMENLINDFRKQAQSSAG
jgi:hypothetical protein